MENAPYMPLRDFQSGESHLVVNYMGAPVRRKVPHGDNYKGGLVLEKFKKWLKKTKNPEKPINDCIHPSNEEERMGNIYETSNI
jgi:hypothetical protein